MAFFLNYVMYHTIESYNIYGTHVTANNIINNNVVFFLFQIWK